MGPAVLITIGVLFLLDQATQMHWFKFWDSTWPALFIVMGLIKLLEHSASAYGHVPREYTRMQPGQPMPPGTPGYSPYGTPGYSPQGPVPPQAPIVTPTPSAPAGFIQPGQPPTGSGDQGGRNG
jgi:hypothetical protein